METWIQGFVQAVCSVIVLIVIFLAIVRYVVKKLDSKVSKETFSEYRKRMDDALIAGEKRFARIDTKLDEMNECLIAVHTIVSRGKNNG